MKNKALLCYVLVMVFATVCTQASASTVTIGTAMNANLAPFGSFYSGEYQQVYSASAFTGGPVLITGISFFSPQYSISGNFGLALSTSNASTSTGAGGLSTTYANNLGANNTQFFSGPVSNVLSFNGTPFLYNPSQGNLLLDVFNYSAASFGALAAGCSTATNRIYNFGGAGAPTSGNSQDCGATGYGLQTQFTYTPVSTAVTPEPTSIVLLGTGLLTLAAAARRRLR